MRVVAGILGDVVIRRAWEGWGAGYGYYEDADQC